MYFELAHPHLLPPWIPNPNNKKTAPKPYNILFSPFQALAVHKRNMNVGKAMSKKTKYVIGH